MTFVKKLKEQDRDKARELYKKLRSLKLVAKVMKRNAITIWRWLRDEAEI